ncbi:Inner membrane protein yhaH [Moraxella lacunata]|uniref:Inner membrane protein yhaH n=1 Tax=Moraxella lacunata TaxID=477 RepID=A0A378TTG0_MORLA|nr:DUF805 domain-containing protein [Moraxella lacunata]STZ63240.1 Inner membrane protein yhaH [Moraxella lacunata]
MTQSDKNYHGTIIAIDSDKQCFSVLADNQKICTLPLKCWQELFDPQINDKIQFGKNSQGIWAKYADNSDNTNLSAINAFSDFENKPKQTTQTHFSQNTHTFHKEQAKPQSEFYQSSQKETLYDNQVRETIEYPYGLFKSYFYTWKRCFDYKGRSRRQEYWYFMLVTTLMIVILSILSIPFSFILAAMSTPYEYQIGQEFELIFGVMILIIIGFVSLIHTLPMIALNIRRCHDLGYSGWLSLLCYVPYLGVLASLFLSFKDSQPDDNAWGDPVK